MTERGISLHVTNEQSVKCQDSYQLSQKWTAYDLELCALICTVN